MAGGEECEDSNLFGGPPYGTDTLKNLMNFGLHSVPKLNLEL